MVSVGFYWKVLKQSVSEWSNDNAMRLAAAVAFYSILSLAPLFVLAVSIGGLMFGEEAARGELVGQIRSLIGRDGAEVVETTLANAKRPDAGYLASAIGIITLLFGASAVFGELHAAMNAVWGVEASASQGIWALIRSKLLSFGMVLSVGFLLLVSLAVSAVLTAFGNYLSGLVPGLPVLMRLADIVISLAVIVFLFALVFQYLPDVRTPWRHVWIGATVTGVLFSIGKYLIGVYLATAAVGSPFGAAGSLVVLVVWVYYSALIVFFGAELTQVHARLSGAKLQAVEGAKGVSDQRVGAEKNDYSEQNEEATHGANGTVTSGHVESTQR